MFFPSRCSQGFWDTEYHHKERHTWDFCAMRGILGLKQYYDLAFQQTDAPVSLLLAESPPSCKTKGNFWWYCSCRRQWEEPTGMNGNKLVSIGKTHCSWERLLWNEEKRRGQCVFQAAGAATKSLSKTGKARFPEIFELPNWSHSAFTSTLSLKNRGLWGHTGPFHDGTLDGWVLHARHNIFQLMT